MTNDMRDTARFLEQQAAKEKAAEVEAPPVPADASPMPATETAGGNVVVVNAPCAVQPGISMTDRTALLGTPQEAPKADAATPEVVAPAVPNKPPAPVAAKAERRSKPRS